MTTTFRKCAIAAALIGAFGAGSASAAVRLSDSFDGNWFNPAANGRGISFDYIPDVTGKSGTLFGATFTYDANGQPTWLVFQPVITEFGYSATAFDVLKVTGGSFAGPIAPGATAISVVGSGSITVNSCSSITVSLDMTPESGLADLSNESLQPLNGTGQGDCAFQREFTACPSFATPAPAFGDRACAITGNFENQDITLSNEITWVVEGKVGIGGDNINSSTLTIEPGTLLVSSGDTFDHIAVSRGSKIFAEGTAKAPIVLTSPGELSGFGDPQPRDVGGIVLAGNAPATCVPNCVAEWDPTLRYGGTNASDNSGVLRYVQVRYAGFIFAPNRELNSFTMNAVGSGTVLDHLQSFKGADDAIEFFGGTANVRYFVDICGGDDSIDWDEGYSGKIQFALLHQFGCAGEDHGFELANDPNNFDASPRASGTIANVTAIGGGAASASSRDGFNLKEGTGGHFWNIVAVNFKRSCVSVQDAATQAASGPVGSLSGLLTMNNTVIDCANSFRDSGVTAGYTQAWFTSQAGNVAADPQLSGFLPATSSPVFGKVFAPTDDWFVPTDYAGAFAGPNASNDWTAGWTHNIGNQ
ncbi:MAG: hypothetical protein CVV14_05695 [Gammaproteobacteria bacterium HGW-Gammaproteobacteria-4]|jgi:hypothetical protein|nr:MAG: hypothetical protein CVV14_05695 [Gammaproteobacteria bacterium HGW-Gammaproteobacteria-4]